jgi:hypothetical protein
MTIVRPVVGLFPCSVCLGIRSPAAEVGVIRTGGASVDRPVHTPTCGQALEFVLSGILEPGAGGQVLDRLSDEDL